MVKIFMRAELYSRFCIHIVNSSVEFIDLKNIGTAIENF